MDSKTNVENNENVKNMKNILDFMNEEAQKFEFEKNSSIIVARIFEILSTRFDDIPTLEEFKKIYRELLKEALNYYDINLSDVDDSSNVPKLQLLSDFALPTDGLNRKVFDVGFTFNKDEQIQLRKNEQISFVASTIYDELLKCNSQLKKLSQFDKRVVVTIANLYNYKMQLPTNNTPYFDITSNQIYKAMNNTTSNPSKNQIQEIEESLKKMKSILIEINIDFLNKQPIKERVKAIPLSGNLIDFQKWAVLDAGHQKYFSVWRFLTEPILFTFARCLGDLWTIPNKYINIKGVDNDLNLVLADFVATTNRDNKPKQEMLFSTIYERIGVNAEDYSSSRSFANKKAKIKKQVEKYFQECKGDLIEDFEIQNTKIVLYKKQKLL